MPEIETSKNVMIINSSLSNNNIFYSDIYIPFIPDIVRLKRIIYFLDGVAASKEVMVLRSDLANDFIATFCEFGAASSIDADYFVGRNVNGKYKFEVLDASLSTTLNVSGKITIHLEFIKYK